MRPVLSIIGFVLAACLVIRAIVEPLIINMGDPATYANDWGGPSLFGVLAVHCGPGLVALGLAVILLVRRRRRGRRTPSTPA